jgi:branched-chain amino acid transport system ATP-binding protein
MNAPPLSGARVAPGVGDVEIEARAVAKEGPILEVSDLGAAYGPFDALFDVTFAIGRGQAVALVGANGAGKSTVARVVTGLVPATAGRVIFDGEDVTNRSAHAIAIRGIAHLTEGRSVFATLTVEENLVLPFRRALGRKAVPGALDEAYERFPRLGERRGQSAGTLSGGEQRMLALARVLVLRQPLLVVDELSFGLAPVVVDEVYAALTQVLDAGTSLLIIEQHVERALELANQVVVLTKGRVAYDGSVAEVRGRLGDLVLGRGGEVSDTAVPAPAGDV